MPSHIAYPSMDQVRQHCNINRETPPDGSVTEVIECRFCNKTFRVKIKGPGGRQKMVNQLPIKLHLLEKHNVQAAALDPKNAQSIHDEMKQLIDKHGADFNKIPLKNVKAFALAFGAKEKCFEEFHRVLKEKFGEEVANKFDQAQGAPNNYGIEMTPKGGVLTHAVTTVGNDLAKDLANRLHKDYKIPKNKMSSMNMFRGGNRVAGAQVQFTDPKTGVSGLVDRREIRIESRNFDAFNWPYPSLFVAPFPFANQEEADRVLPFFAPGGEDKLIPIQIHPVDCGGKVPASLVGASEQQTAKYFPAQKQNNNNNNNNNGPAVVANRRAIPRKVNIADLARPVPGSGGKKVAVSKAELHAALYGAAEEKKTKKKTVAKKAAPKKATTAASTKKAKKETKTTKTAASATKKKNTKTTVTKTAPKKQAKKK